MLYAEVADLGRACPRDVPRWPRQHRCSLVRPILSSTVRSRRVPAPLGHAGGAGSHLRQDHFIATQHGRYRWTLVSGVDAWGVQLGRKRTRRQRSRRAPPTKAPTGPSRRGSGRTTSPDPGTIRQGRPRQTPTHSRCRWGPVGRLRRRGRSLPGARGARPRSIVMQPRPSASRAVPLAPSNSGEVHR